MPAKTLDRTKTIWRMYNEGQPTKKIAAALGVKYSLVSCAVSRGRQTGAVPPLKPASPLSDGTMYYLNRGTMGYLVGNLTREQQIWLAHQAQDYGCDTLAEVVLEIVRDAHADAIME